MDDNDAQKDFWFNLKFWIVVAVAGLVIYEVFK